MREQCSAESVLRPIETVPLPEIDAALETQRRGFPHVEAAARLVRSGQETLRQVATTALVRKLLAHFTHLRALRLWAGGLLGFLAQRPQ